MILDVMLDYFRLAFYGIIILTSLSGILKKKYSNLLFFGDIVMSIGLLLSGLHINIFNKEPRFFADVFLTPTAFFWAAIHFYNFWEENNLTIKRYKSTIRKGE